MIKRKFVEFCDVEVSIKTTIVIFSGIVMVKVVLRQKKSDSEAMEICDESCIKIDSPIHFWKKGGDVAKLRTSSLLLRQRWWNNVVGSISIKTIRLTKSFANTSSTVGIDSDLLLLTNIL
nr:10026_t:CDS:2 [Entrophospora candida]